MAGVTQRGVGRTIAIAALAIFVVAAAAAPVAVAKKKRLTIVSTTSTAAPLGPGGAASTTAPCSKGTHITGGGFSVTPEFSGNPASPTGLKSLNQVSFPSALNSWTATAGSLPPPATAGVLNAFARCEHNKLGKLAGVVFGPQVFAAGDYFTLDLQCPTGTHVLSGGYSLDKPFDAGNAMNTSKLIVLGSSRVSTTEWAVTAFNPTTPLATLSPYAICEKKGSRGITQASAAVPFTDNAANGATATCSKKHHAVGGGFAFAPVTGPPPFAEVDESAPVGARQWTARAYDISPLAIQPGTTFSVYAYCRSDSTKKKK